MAADFRFSLAAFADHGTAVGGNDLSSFAYDNDGSNTAPNHIEVTWLAPSQLVAAKGSSQEG
jgi:hypothetical protein